MPWYRVHITRTEDISFLIEASNRLDADARFLVDGEEETADTLALEINRIERIDDAT